MAFSHKKLDYNSLKLKREIIYLFSGINNELFSLLHAYPETVSSDLFNNLYRKSGPSTLFMNFWAYEDKPSFEFYKEIENRFELAFEDVHMTPNLEHIYIENNKLVQILSDHYSKLNANQLIAQRLYNQTIEVFRGVISIRNFEDLTKGDIHTKPVLMQTDYLLFENLYMAAQPVALANHSYYNFICVVKALTKDYDDLFKRVHGDLNRGGKALINRGLIHRNNIESIESLVNELEVSLMLSQ